jgi:hypothetical protein
MTRWGNCDDSGGFRVAGKEIYFALGHKRSSYEWDVELRMRIGRIARQSIMKHGRTGSYLNQTHYRYKVELSFSKTD